MGAKMIKKTVAVLIAAALVFTSCIAVFADTEADEVKSPSVGKIATLYTYVYTGRGNIIVMDWPAAENAKSYSVFINGVEVASGLTALTYTYKAKANQRYDIFVRAYGEDGSYRDSAVAKRWVKKSKKATAKKTGKRKIKVCWKKVKKSTKYRIAIIRNGKIIKVINAKGTCKTIKVPSKGKYRFLVYARYKNTVYKSEQVKTNYVTIK